MPGSFDLDGYTPALSGPAMAVGVYLYDPDAEQPLSLLPNIWCLRIDYREGPEPPVARFRYILDGNMAINFGWPARIGDVWPIDAQGPYVVLPDDRLIVAAQNPDGSPLYLFDGFAQIPQADVTPRTEDATFVAVGVAVRAWDDTIHTRIQRDADDPDDTSGESDFEVHLPCRFNPADQRPGSMGGYLGNSTPDALYTVPEGSNDGGYPVFVDPLLAEREDDLVEPWYISDSLLYLLALPNPGDDYIAWPSSDTITDLLETLAPPPGSTTFNPQTAVPSDCVIRDYDATDKTLPEVMADLLGYAGFLMTWQLGADGDDNPETSLRFYRRDGAATGPIKSVYLDVPGASLAAGSLNNASHLHLTRDTNHVVNAWRVETAQQRAEISVILAPLFEPTASDAQAANRSQFNSANLTNATATTRRKYRWYGADECGDGHWNMLEGEWSVQPLDLATVFPNTDANIKSYCTRYRPGSNTLIATDSDDRPLRAVLEYYAPAASTYSSDPYVQTEQGASGWLTIKNGWRLLDDRLGIEVTVPDPEEWTTGNPKLPKIAGISQVATAGTNNWQPFTLRLTTTIESDLRIDARAPKRIASPTQFARWRSADAADHFQYTTITPGSINYPTAGGDGTNPVVVRDDTAAATTHAQQLRSSHEMPPLAGSVTLPGISVAYSIGDRVSLISGRAINLQTNIGASQGEASVFPWIVGLSWDFEGDRQSTTLVLSDRRTDTTRNTW
jgi:hypothetical protein